MTNKFESTKMKKTNSGLRMDNHKFTLWSIVVGAAVAFMIYVATK